MRVIVVALLMITVAMAGCSSTKDTDGDGIPDAVEKAGWSITVFLLDTSEVRHVTSDPKKVDTDNDGFTDYEEWFRPLVGSLDPSSADTDNDGLSDCQEALHTVLAECTGGNFPKSGNNFVYDGGYKTSPLMSDSDSGLTRYVNNHLNNGQGYLDPVGAVGNNGVRAFGDGISDGDEINGYTVTLADGSVIHNMKTDPLNPDSDGDDLEDGEEAYLYGSSSYLTDSDGDGCTDGFDPYPMLAEKFALDLGDFTLYDGPAVDGANLVIGAAFDETFLVFPEEGHVNIAEGETVDMSVENKAPARDDRCYLRPSSPWMQFQVVAYHKPFGGANDNAEAADNQQLATMDIASATDPDGNELVQIWWHIHQDAFRWSLPDLPNRWDSTADSEAMIPADGSMLEFDGINGKISFRPRVE